MKSGERQRALCILGMHRSGTSAVTRAFNLFGAFVGDEADLMRESPTNPEGYWERNDIFECHERLLAAVQRRWDTGLMLPDGWHHAPEVTPYREELKRIVATTFAGRPFWAWKDPRSCILLDLWKDILGESGADLSVVVVVRHPRDVAASLSRRNGFGLEKSCGIWFSHNLAALRSVEGVRTAFVGYDSFLEDPVGQVRRCAEALGLTGPAKADAADAAIRMSVRKDLRHSRTTIDALEDLPPPVRELFGLLCRAAEKPASCDDVFSERIRELHREYSAYAGFFREDLERGLDALATERRALIAEEQARVLARDLEKIVTSKIWRFTAPARNASDFLRGKFRPGSLPDS